MAVAVATAGIGSASSAGTISIAKPTGLAVGDLMVARVHYRGDPLPAYTGGDFAATGAEAWTVLQTPSFIAASQWIAWKRASDADVAKTAFGATTASTFKWTGIIVRLTGHDATTPIQASLSTGSNTTGTAHSVPSVAGSTGGMLLAFIVGSVSGTWTVITGATKTTTDQATVGGGGQGGATAQHLALTATGATGAKASTGPSGTWAGSAVTVAQAAAPPPSTSAPPRITLPFPSAAVIHAATR